MQQWMPFVLTVPEADMQNSGSRALYPSSRHLRFKPLASWLSGLYIEGHGPTNKIIPHKAPVLYVIALFSSLLPYFAALFLHLWLLQPPHSLI